MRVAATVLVVLSGVAVALGSAAGSIAPVPIVFEPAEGRLAPDTLFVAHGRDRALLLEQDRIVLAPRGGPRIVMRLEGARSRPIVEGEGLQAGTSSFFLGSDPDRWCTGVPHYARVRYRDVYPGVDLVLHGVESSGDSGIEYDFEVAPGACAERIAMAFEDEDGTPLPTFVGPEGDLVVAAPGGVVIHRRPVAYQPIAGTHRAVEASFQATARGIVQLEVSGRDEGAGLVIDPILAFGSYLGGSDADGAAGVAVDATGNVYISGGTQSVDFPILAALQPSEAGYVDLIVAKISPSGSLLFATYLGGFASDGGGFLALTPSGDIVVSGTSQSSDFPTTAGSFQPSFGGTYDATVTTIKGDGSALVYSTFVGGSDTEGSPLQASRLGIYDAFVTKLDPSGSNAAYSTYLGGSAEDDARGVAIDLAGSAYVVGITTSSDFPLANPIDPTLNGADDGFVTKIDPNGSSLVYSTYLGGGGQDPTMAVAVDSAGRAVVVGHTFSSNFPVLAPAQGTCGSCPGAADAFVTKFNASGTGYVYSTYVGGPGDDLAIAVALDPSEDAYVYGYSWGGGFPTLCAMQPQAVGQRDDFIVKFDALGAKLYATYLGGTDFEDGYGAIAVDAAGAVYAVGATGSTDFPVPGAFQPANAGGFEDAFVVKILDQGGCGPPVADFMASPVSGPAPLPVAFTSLASGTIVDHDWSFGDGGTANAMSPSHVYTTPGTYDVTYTVTGGGTVSGLTRPRYIHVEPPDADDIVAGAGAGPQNPSRVRIFSWGGVVEQDWLAYGAGGFGVTVAGGDVDDGGAEVLTGPGPGPVYGPHVRAFDRAASPLAKVSFYAYGTLRYGANVAAADLDGDYYAEIVTGAGAGAVFGPHVRGFDYDGARLTALAKVSFFAYQTLRYGVDVAGADVDGDRYAELLTGPGPSPAFAPQVRGFDYDGTAVTAIASINGNVFPPLQYGCRVGAGDVDGDGLADGVFGPGPGPALATRLRGFSLRPLVALPGLDQIVDPGTFYGLEPAAGDVDGDGVDEPIGALGPDPAAASRLQGYDYAGSALTAIPAAGFDAFPGLSFGAAAATGLLGY